MSDYHPAVLYALFFLAGVLACLLVRDVMDGADIEILVAWLLPPALLSGLVGFIAANFPRTPHFRSPGDAPAPRLHEETAPEDYSQDVPQRRFWGVS